MTSEAGAGIVPGKDDVELLFLGTGTSAGVPMIGCDCETCTSTDPRDNRTRCSVVISYDGEAGERVSVLVDTTPELRIQAVANQLRRVDALVFTHAHADHLMGLDDVRRAERDPAQEARIGGLLIESIQLPGHFAFEKAFQESLRGSGFLPQNHLALRKARAKLLDQAPIRGFQVPGEVSMIEAVPSHGQQETPLGGGESG